VDLGILLVRGIFTVFLEQFPHLGCAQVLAEIHDLGFQPAVVDVRSKTGGQFVDLPIQVFWLQALLLGQLQQGRQLDRRRESPL
jgi:hypothetical protein